MDKGRKGNMPKLYEAGNEIAEIVEKAIDTEPIDYYSEDFQEYVRAKFNLELGEDGEYKGSCPFCNNGEITLDFQNDFAMCFKCNYTSGIDRYTERYEKTLYED